MTIGIDNAAETLLAQPLGPRVRDLELPEAQAVGRRRLRRPTRKAILASLFYVYGQEAKLEAPIDWLQDPYESRSWRYELHTLTWLKEALARMRATLGATVDFDEGAHLEHSPAYQLAIVELVSRLAANVGELPELGALLERMRRTAAWQVTPRGCLAQLGDTDDSAAPAWARDTAGSLRGLHALPHAGQAFVREGDSYLAVSAAYHGAAHKHADDSGFLLVEKGQAILGDAGRWGYYEDEPDRLHARGATAHNVLTVDAQDFEWRGADPYGSGLGAAVEAGGWHTIVLRNPLLARQGVEHRRALLYRPAEALVVVDEVRSDREHEYVRRLHFGPELELEQIAPDRLAISGKGIAATLVDFAPGGETSLVRGQDNPRLGWTYPGDRERTPIWTAVMRSRRESALFASALTLGGEPPSDLWGVLATHPLLRDDAAGLEVDDPTELDAILEMPLEDDDRRTATGARQ